MISTVTSLTKALQGSPEVILFNKVTGSQVCQHFRVMLKATVHSTHTVTKVALEEYKVCGFKKYHVIE